MSRSPFYVTTPIYYVNDVPHIGHAYTTVAADVMARYQRLAGRKVFFLTGTDEHGQKVEKAAAQSGEQPIDLADRMVLRFQHLWARLGISNDDFIRTTQRRHIETVQNFFRAVEAAGDIYKGVYEDWYCIPCETFWTELQLVGGNCPDCGRPVERLKEESYFFRMSAYGERLLAHIRKNPDFIHPRSRRNEVIGFVSGGLKDLSISRVTFRWGIPVPSDERHVIYVWFDALVNYLTAAGYGADPDRFKKLWPADVHLIGKDILRFHAVYWPCFLLAAGLPLPRRIVTHGWWTIEGEKMSKSKGNVVDPNVMIDRYGADAFRFFLLREVPFGDDGDFSESSLVRRFNSELANDLGNLVSRTLTMIERYAGGRISSPSKTATAADRKLRTAASGLYKKVPAHLEKWAFHLTLKEIWVVVDLANRYIEQNAPWELARDGKKAGRLGSVLYHLAEVLRLLCLYLYPFMPVTATALAAQLGVGDPEAGLLDRDRRWGRLKPGEPVRKGQNLFPRIDREAIETQHSETAPQKETKPVIEEKQESDTLTIEDFKKLRLRAGRITSAEAVPGASRLLKLLVDIGGESRQIVAGIAPRYRPEEVVGMSVIVVANLKPAVIRGVESQGMILAAGDKEAEAIATFKDPPEPGTPVR